VSEEAVTLSTEGLELALRKRKGDGRGGRGGNLPRRGTRNARVPPGRTAPSASQIALGEKKKTKKSLRRKEIRGGGKSPATIPLELHLFRLKKGEREKEGAPIEE